MSPGPEVRPALQFSRKAFAVSRADDIFLSYDSSQRIEFVNACTDRSIERAGNGCLLVVSLDDGKNIWKTRN